MEGQRLPPDLARVAHLHNKYYCLLQYYKPLFDDIEQKKQTLRNEVAGFFFPNDEGKEGVRPTKLLFSHDSLVGVGLPLLPSSMAL